MVIQGVARQFFEAREAGDGWAACRAYCKPDASFSAQAEPLVDVKTMQGYADWMQSLMQSHYDLKCFAMDASSKAASRCCGGKVPAQGPRACRRSLRDRRSH